MELLHHWPDVICSIRPRTHSDALIRVFVSTHPAIHRVPGAAVWISHRNDKHTAAGQVSHRHARILHASALHASPKAETIFSPESIFTGVNGLCATHIRCTARGLE